MLLGMGARGRLGIERNLDEAHEYASKYKWDCKAYILGGYGSAFPNYDLFPSLRMVLP